MTRRRLLRAYTVAVAILCCAAVTLVAHDDPVADAAGARARRCDALRSQLAALRVRRVALERQLVVARRRLRLLAVTAPRRRRALLATLAASRRSALRRALGAVRPLPATPRTER